MLLPDVAVFPPQLSTEGERLQALHHYQILDTPTETAFERTAALAARLFHVPIALISLVDEHRQWFKACIGLDLRQTDRSLSFCAHALESSDVLVVPDATLDPRFMDNGLVTGSPHLRFYAGAPLRAPGGHTLGTLCILDTLPRPALTLDEQAILQDLATSVVSELELRLALQTTQAALLEQQRSETAKTAILNAALDCIITVDQASRITEWNPVAERTFGYLRTEALGQELSTLIIPERLRSAHHRGMTHYLRTGEGPVLGRRIEVPALRRDGTEFPCEMAISPYLLDGQPVFTAYLRDLTERKTAENALATSHNLLQAMVDAVPASIFVKDLDARYLMINATGAAHIGRPVEDILGRDDHAVFAPEVALASQRREHQILASGQTAVYEVTELAGDQTLRNLLCHKRVYRDSHGEIVGLIGSAIDITEQKQTELLIRELNVGLELRVAERTQALEEAQFEVLDRLARAAELRDDETGEHVRRVARMSGALGHLLGLLPTEVSLLERVASLHDVGKIGIPDAVLLKPGRLTAEEFEAVKAHALIGGTILSGGTSRLVQAAQEVALTHHERWDGSGYPAGLSGEAIPLYGRIVAVADVYDALISERPYKRAWKPEEVLHELQAQAGRQFDPQIVEALKHLVQGL